MYLAFVWNKPFLTLASSTKDESAVELSARLVSVNAIFNLWAPLAAKFDEPVALSVSELSDSGVIKLSVIVKPSLADAVVDVALITWVCSAILTNCPRI